MSAAHPALIEEITAIVARIAEVPADEIAPADDLRVEHGVDSLLGLQIVAALEKRYDVRVPDEDLDKYVTVGEIASVVAQLRAPVSAAATGSTRRTG